VGRPNAPDEHPFWRVAIVEDHLLQRRRTEELLAEDPYLTVVHACEALPDLLAWLRTVDVRQRPHIVILDLMVDRGDDARPEHIQLLTGAGIRVLVLSAMASPKHVRDVLRAGVHGVVGKRDSEDQIIEAVWAVLGRQTWMTPELAAVMAGDASRPALSDQEERALVLYASGLTLDAVAAEIGVQPGTAKKYLERVKEKYASAGRPVRTKVDLSREAARDGLLDDR